MKKNCWANYKWAAIQNQIVKVVLDLSNYAAKTEIKDARGIDTSNLAAKRDFIALNAKVDKLYINRLVNNSTCLNNLKQN